jgi:hypothetical protein
VSVRVEAIPERALNGRVTSVSTTPEPGSWFNSAVKEYAVLVSLDDTDEALRIGMTAVVEIDVSADGNR